MAWSLILVLLLFIVGAILIFKLIKKLVMAIILVIVLFILLFGGVVAYAAYDVNDLSKTQDLDVNIIYKDGDNELFGAMIPVRNQEVDLESVKGLSKSDVESINELELENDDAEFVVFIQKDLFEKVVPQEIDVAKVLGEDQLPSELGDEFNLKLSKSEILTLVNSEDSTSQLVEIIFTNNPELESLRFLIEDVMVEAINAALSETGFTINQAVFLFALTQGIEQDQSNAILLLEGYKDDELEVYPQRFSFSLLKMLPTSIISSFIE